jgi:metal-dependent amidase/aminoacylase/carboxypeptidase family protein
MLLFKCFLSLNSISSEMKLTEQELSELVCFRKNMHAHPELSEEEEETAKSNIKYLECCKPSEIHSSIGGHGVIGVFNSNKPGPNILFRADIDALPIEEENDFGHQSQISGVSHKCGHDGHTSIFFLKKFLQKRVRKREK